MLRRETYLKVQSHYAIPTKALAGLLALASLSAAQTIVIVVMVML